ncbi:MAG TPA: hypothetical protein VMV77_03835 [Bacteroidales bacterium]|nr:hypothetical protein [Bacteroidales bacterium]
MTGKIEIEKIIRELDPHLDKTSDTFKRATILIASIFVGANKDKISDLLKIKRNDKTLLEVDERARKSKIWKGNKVHCNWMDKKSGGVDFWLDVCVVEGYIKRTLKKKAGKS